MTDTLETAQNTRRTLNPDEIGLIVKTCRVDLGWTQETLAELSSLTVRTIQRIEQGQPSSLDTRRSLARAFQFPDIDFFNTLVEFPSEAALKSRKEAFDRDYIVLDASPVTGRQLLVLIKDGPNFRGLAPGSLNDLTATAQDAFAFVLDFIRDCMDALDVVSHAEILEWGDMIDVHMAELNRLGFACYAATRSIKLSNKAWKDPTPLESHVVYLHAYPKDHPVTKIAVSRKISFRF